MSEFVRGQHALDMMLMTSIYRDLESGEIAEAKRHSAKCTSLSILAIKNIENYPIWSAYLEMLPWHKAQKTDYIVKRHLTEAQSFFSQHPNVLLPEASNYLDAKTK